MDNEMDNALVEQTKSAESSAEVFQAQAQKAGEQSFAAAKDIGANMRALLEKSLHETRTAYAKSKGVAQEASSALEASYGAARQGVAEINVKAIEAMKLDADAHFNLLTSMASVKSISDMVTLNTEFVRKRFEEATARAKAFSELARKVADETASPIRDQVAKTVKFAS